MRADRNTRVLLGLVGVVLVMGALAWAAVPFYSWFCRVTGYGGTTQVASAESDVVLDRTIRVRFDANVDKDMGWRFAPMQREMVLRIGETGLAFYEAVNTSDETITGTASYNVAPDATGRYFDKIECFCFTEQTLAPGERIEMPVSFFVDPAIVDDLDTARTREITLSYTFHRAEPSVPVAKAEARTEARLDAPADGLVN